MPIGQGRGCSWVFILEMFQKLIVSMFMVVSSACAHAQVEDYLQYVPTAMNFALEPCGVKPVHSLKDRLFVTVAAWGITYGVAGGLKMTVHEWRPDDSDDKAFPSGHSAKAFCGANLVMHEYKDVSPWIGISAYAIAATTATLRVTHRKHYVHDVLAGAAIGILSSEAAYLMLPLWQKLTTKKDNNDNDKGNIAIAIFPSASTEHIALTGAIVF